MICAIISICRNHLFRNKIIRSKSDAAGINVTPLKIHHYPYILSTALAFFSSTTCRFSLSVGPSSPPGTLKSVARRSHFCTRWALDVAWPLARSMPSLMYKRTMSLCVLERYCYSTYLYGLFYDGINDGLLHRAGLAADRPQPIDGVGRQRVGGHQGIRVNVDLRFSH